jgi:hypothetical protein
MAAVKGSKQEKMIVVPYRPGRVLLLRAVVVCCLLLSGGASFWYGMNLGLSENGDARAERDSLRVEMAESNAQSQAMREQFLSLQQTSMLDKQALDDVQQTILSLRDKISQLEEDVLFYKQITSQENTETGLVIGQVDLFATGEAGVFRYKFELRQQGNNESLVTGHLNVNILGRQGEQEVSIPLRSISDSEPDLDIKLLFRYFQNIEGTLVLPENFQPERIQLLAVGETPAAKTVQKTFGWVVRS